MLRASSLLACAAAAAFVSVASPTFAATADIDASASPYGLFLAGQAAMHADDDATAADYFSAVVRDTGSPEARENAFLALLQAGEVTRAVAMAPAPDEGSPAVVRLARLVDAVEDIATGKGRKAVAVFAKGPIGYPHRTAEALLKPWAAAAAKDWKTATADQPANVDRVTFILAEIGRAELLERAGRDQDAEAALKLMNKDGVSTLMLNAYSNFLERHGRRADAIALYDAALAKAPDDGGLMEARTRLAAPGREAPPLGDVRAGAARAMTNAAAAALLSKQAALSIIYLRLALRLDPQSDDAWLALGDALAQDDDDAGAREAYAHVGPKSSAFVEARVKTIWSYQSDDKSHPEALKLAEDLAAAAPGDALAQTTLADSLRIDKQYGASVRVLDKLIAAEGPHASWKLYYLRAQSLDRSGRWPDAERDLQTGLKLQPDQAELLNYLGYSWIDRGEHLKEALEMIQKAVISEPDSGAVVDSLGWAYYRLGDYPKAVANLERAAQLDPVDPDVNNHLGDAYWQVGRRIEAGFQWSKVLADMDPDPALKAEIERKLKDGLPAGKLATPPAKVAER